MGTIALDTILLTAGDYTRLVQRASGVGSIALSGTHTGGTSIEARIVKYSDETDLAMPFGWVEIQGSATSPWSGTLTTIPEGPQTADDDWYAIQVRLGNETGTTASSKTASEKFGVGAWVGIIGQSNAEGLHVRWAAQGVGSPDETDYGTYPKLTADDRACQIARVNGYTAVAALDIDINDGIIKYADEFLSNEDVPIGFYCSAYGSTYLDIDSYDDSIASSKGANWLSVTADEGYGGYAVPLYTEFITKVTAMGGCELVIWNQGENDGEIWHAGTSHPNTDYTVDPHLIQSKYYANLNSLITNLRSDIASVPILLCTLPMTSKNRDLTNFPTTDRVQEIRSAQIQVCEETTGVYRVDTSMYAMRMDNLNYLHLNLASRQSLGTKLAYIHSHHLDSGTYPYTPPTITDFKQISTTSTTVTVSESGLLPTSAIEGFTVTDASGAEYAISTATLSGTTVTLTHASVDFVREVRYCFGACKTSGIAGASIADGTTPAVLTRAAAGAAPEIPLSSEASLTQEYVRKIEDKHNTTRKEHHHWNDDVLGKTTASFVIDEKTKLAGIETAATADQNGSEIVALIDGVVEANNLSDISIPAIAAAGTPMLLHDGNSATNMYIGQAAGNPSLAAGARTDSSCVGIGNATLQYVTDAIYCMAIGRRAQRFNEDCVGIVAIGNGSAYLFDNYVYGTKGYHITAIGHNSMTGAAAATVHSATGVGNASAYNATGYEFTAIGNEAGKIANNNSTHIGNAAGKYDDDANVLHINSFNRTNKAGDKAGSIIYGVQNATPASQTLTFNANVNCSYGLDSTVIGANIAAAGTFTTGTFSGAVNYGSIHKPLVVPITVTSSTSYSGMTEALSGSTFVFDGVGTESGFVISFPTAPADGTFFNIEIIEDFTSGIGLSLASGGGDSLQRATNLDYLGNKVGDIVAAGATSEDIIYTKFSGTWSYSADENTWFFTSGGIHDIADHRSLTATAANINQLTTNAFTDSVSITGADAGDVQLKVLGDSAQTEDILQITNSASAEFLTVRSNGYLDLGTSHASRNNISWGYLNSADKRCRLFIYAATGGAVSTTLDRIAGTNGALYLDQAGTGSINFRTNGSTQAVEIDSSQKVTFSGDVEVAGSGVDRTVLVAGAQVVGTTLALAGTTNAPVPYNTKKYDPETITISGSYDITPGAGSYFIEASTSFEQLSFNARATAATRIEENIDGAGYTTVADSEGYGYSRIYTGTDKVTVTSFGYVVLDADDTIRVQAFIDEGGTDTIRTLALGCTVRIQRL